MYNNLYRIEYLNGSWTVRDVNGWETYYCGDSRQDCETWVQKYNGKIIEVIIN